MSVLHVAVSEGRGDAQLTGSSAMTFHLVAWCYGMRGAGGAALFSSCIRVALGRCGAAARLRAGLFLGEQEREWATPAILPDS